MTSDNCIASNTTYKRLNGLLFLSFVQLGLVSGVALVVGGMIGSGIFISPKGILENTQSVGMSIIIWVLCGVISMCGKA